MQPDQIESYVRLYLDEKRRIIDRYPVAEIVRAAELVFETYEAGGTIFAMGNGGNAGTVDHIFCDFKHHPFVTESKTEALPPEIKRLNFVNLGASPAELTGLVNDLGAEWMFAGALAPLVRRGDLVMGFSGSGNSANVLKAFEVARERGARTLAIARGDGGRCREAADLCILIPGTSRFPGQTGRNDNNFHFEDAILSISSMIVGMLKEKVAQRVAEERAAWTSRR